MRASESPVGLLADVALIDEFGAEFVADPPCQPALPGVIG
jgi:hypothetical protein